MLSIILKVPFVPGYDVEIRIYIQSYGKYSFKYIIGDLNKIFYKSLFAELMVKTWHPNRVEDWCFDADDFAIRNDFERVYCSSDI